MPELVWVHHVSRFAHLQSLLWQKMKRDNEKAGRKTELRYERGLSISSPFFFSECACHLISLLNVWEKSCWDHYRKTSLTLAWVIKTKIEKERDLALGFRKCLVLNQHSSKKKQKKTHQSSWGHNDPLTFLQIREMKKVSSWLLWCLFKELPVCYSLFYLSHRAAIGVHMIDVVSSLRLSRLPDEQILYRLRFGECV